MPRLVIRRGAERLLEVRVEPGRTVVGRSDACDVVVPGEDVSRTHCILHGSEEGWEVEDTSRHGTRVDGRRVEGRVPLEDGATLQVGAFQLVFELREVSRERTATVAAAGPPPEKLVAAEDGLTVEYPLLRVVAGPEQGREIPLRRPRTTLGGPGSDVVLADPTLVPHHLELLVTRGRLMCSPGAGSAWLDGDRVDAVTPVYVDEQIRVGGTVLQADTAWTTEEREADAFGEMVATSETMRRLFGVLRRLARHHAPVLLCGETGTGKELCARGLHESGPRADGPFVALNCGSVVDGLFESELFGHERGAFTGAVSRRDGAFQRADRGTLFLDEVGELPEGAQARLLRALETGEVRRVGSHVVEYPDVRVVAATNRDLERMVQEGRFRADLYFRLAVLAVEIPPLRDHVEDLPVIAQALARRLDPSAAVAPDALEVLRHHDFPGNVRELRNVLTRAYVLGGRTIRARDISFTPWAFQRGSTRRSPVTDVVVDTERRLLQEALVRHGGNRSAVARELGIARSTLHYKLRKHRLLDA